jgi:hypothetical protein
VSGLRLRETGHHVGKAFGAIYFRIAARLWLKDRRNLSPSSRKYYEHYIASLTKFFRLLSLDRIHIGHVASISGPARPGPHVAPPSRRQPARRALPSVRESDGASLINHELSCLGQIMHRAGLWERSALL